MNDFKVQLFTGRELRAVALMVGAVVVIGASAAVYLGGSRPGAVAAVAAPSAAPRPTPAPAGLMGFDFVSPAEGWVAARSGGTVGLLHTTDSGGHWRQAGEPLGRCDAVRLTFFDRKHGYVICSELRAAYRVSMRSTEDGGDHWRQIVLPGGEGPPSFQAYFSDPENGWYVQPLGGPIYQPGVVAFVTPDLPFAVSRSRDGGRTWEEVTRVDSARSAASSGLPLEGLKLNIRGYGPERAFIQIGGGAPAFYFTENGGRSWERSAVTAPAGGWAPEVRYSGGVMASGAEGLAVAGFVRLQPDAPAPPTGGGVQASRMAVVGTDLLATTDGGRSWRTREFPAADHSSFSQAYVLDRSHWWLVDGAAIEFSADGGASRRAVPGPLAAPGLITGIRFFDERHGVVSTYPFDLYAGPSGQAASRLFETWDGVHWKELKLPPG